METEILVIGGGATGCGVAWDAALRGFATVLVERGALASGTTGRFHGLLHSGARYAVTDPVAAQECASESAILRRIAPACVADTGGLVLALPGDDPGYVERFPDACAAAGIEVAEARSGDHPAVSQDAVQAFSVPDAVLDGRALVQACARAARRAGAVVLEQARVVRFLRAGTAVAGAVVRRGDRELELHAPVVVNAAGAWAGAVATLAGCGVPARLSAGVLVAVTGPEGPAVPIVVSRCRAPGDGDIVVPLGGELVIGTTDTPVDYPEGLPDPDPAVPGLLAAGADLVPGIAEAVAAGARPRAWTAVRPLVAGTAAPPGTSSGRGLSRGHLVIDHAFADRVGGLITVTGGKATTFRLMAEDAVDAACRILGSREPCRTAGERLDAGGVPGGESGTLAP
ncbi:MAG TPA: FAD-dependent oxidoreductase [Actinomycetota bacterium]|nr:FAD-dependent oxidoreductase [Actinomycetota bacterium]